MANYFYALSNSITNGVDGADALFTTYGDTVTLARDAYIVAYGGGSAWAVHGRGTNINNSGLIQGYDLGVSMDTTLANWKASITNQASGVISGGRAAINATGTSSNGISINNLGSIAAMGDHGVNNTGFGIQISSGYADIKNSGTISGSGSFSYARSIFADTAAEHVTVFNSGTLNGQVEYNGGHFLGLELNNSGTINGDVYTNVATLTYVSNGGVVNGSIRGGALFPNTGFQSHFIANGGSVSGDVSLWGASYSNEFKGIGVLIGGNVNLGVAADTVILSGGGQIGGYLNCGAGDDTVDTVGGTVKGIIDLGAGADTFTGGDAVDKVVGGDGNDDIDLNGGNDIYYAGGATAASDGNDVVDGGLGADTYVARALGLTGITIDLLDSIATGVSFGTDHIFNFENATGTANADTLIGTNGINTLNGGAGNDTINGLAGNDRLVGGLGADTIIGGAGQDVMTGGAVTTGGDGARDTFLFLSLADSGPAAGARDWITDFTNGALATSDRINLVAIDANTVLAGNQAFIWQAAAGAAFTGVAGQLHYAITGGNTYVSGDVNGDKVADFSVVLSGSHALAAIDFVL
jgi:RTX calcium-binding nonapeptide repeat (4 copies)